MSIPTAWQSELPRDARRSPIVALASLSGIALIIWVFSSGLLGTDMGALPLVLLSFVVYGVTLIDLRVGLAITVIAIGISPEFSIAGIPNLRIEDFVMPILALAWFGRMLFLRETLEPTPLYRPIFLGLFLALLSILKNIATSGLEFAVWGPRMAKELELIFMFIVSFHLARTRDEARTFIYLMLAAGTTVGLYGVFQSTATLGQPEYRVPGPPGETANILGAYLAFHIAIALGLLSSNPRLRLLAIPSFLVMFVPLVRTLSRTSYVALFVSLIVLYILRRGRLIGILLIAILLILALSSTGERFSTILTIFSAPPPSWQARVDGWKALLLEFPRTPLLGRGPGSIRLGYADSEIVLRLGEVGILGFAAFAWLILLAFRTGLTAARRADDGVLAGYGVGYVAGLAGLAAHAVAATTFTSIRPAESFFIATGIACAIAARHAKGAADERPDPSPIPSPLIRRTLPRRPGSSRRSSWRP